MRILLVNGPNLNSLGHRDARHYGHVTLEDIQTAVVEKAAELGAEVVCYQANGEGEIIDFLQREARGANGIIINPGALTHYGYSLRDALEDSQLPFVEVHLSNIHAREEFRNWSIIASIAHGQINGMGWRGYLLALEYLVSELTEEDKV